LTELVSALLSARCLEKSLGNELMRTVYLVPCIVLALTSSAAPFQNLGFDEANTNQVHFAYIPPGGQDHPYGFGPIGDLLPGWQLFDGTNKFTTLGFDYDEISDATTLLSTNFPETFFPIEGSYALRLGGRADLSLVQTGDIPADAKFLRYDFTEIPFSVTINGATLAHSFGFLSAPNYRTNAVFDISQFAGQNVELKFKLVDLGPMGYGNIGYLDSITFIPGAPAPILHIQQQATNITVTWIGDSSITLQSSASAVGPWQTVSNAFSPYTVPTSSTKLMFFRLAIPP
jgi:hypothetical protein